MPSSANESSNLLCVEYSADGKSCEVPCATYNGTMISQAASCYPKNYDWNHSNSINQNDIIPKKTEDGSRVETRVTPIEIYVPAKK